MYQNIWKDSYVSGGKGGTNLSLPIYRNFSVFIYRNFSLFIYRNYSVFIYRNYSVFIYRNLSLFIYRNFSLFIYRNLSLIIYRSFSLFIYRNISLQKLFLIYLQKRFELLKHFVCNKAVFNLMNINIYSLEVTEYKHSHSPFFKTASDTEYIDFTGIENSRSYRNKSAVRFEFTQYVSVH